VVLRCDCCRGLVLGGVRLRSTGRRAAGDHELSELSQPIPDDFGGSHAERAGVTAAGDAQVVREDGDRFGPCDISNFLES